MSTIIQGPRISGEVGVIFRIEERDLVNAAYNPGEITLKSGDLVVCVNRNEDHSYDYLPLEIGRSFDDPGMTLKITAGSINAYVLGAPHFKLTEKEFQHLKAGGDIRITQQKKSKETKFLPTKRYRKSFS